MAETPGQKGQPEHADEETYLEVKRALEATQEFREEPEK